MRLKDYISQLSSTLLSVQLSDSTEIADLLDKFAQDPNLKVIYAIEERVFLVFNWIETSRRLELLLDLNARVYTSACLVFLKRVPILSNECALSSQIQMIHLPNPSDSSNAYENLYSIVHHAISPFLETCSTQECASGNELETSKSGRNDMSFSSIKDFLLQKNGSLNSNSLF